MQGEKAGADGGAQGCNGRLHDPVKLCRGNWHTAADSHTPTVIHPTPTVAQSTATAVAYSTLTVAHPIPTVPQPIPAVAHCRPTVAHLTPTGAQQSDPTSLHVREVFVIEHTVHLFTFLHSILDRHTSNVAHSTSTAAHLTSAPIISPAFDGYFGGASKPPPHQDMPFTRSSLRSSKCHRKKCVPPCPHQDKTRSQSGIVLERLLYRRPRLPLVQYGRKNVLEAETLSNQCSTPTGVPN